MKARFEKVAADPHRSFQVGEYRLARFDAPWHFHPEVELTLILGSRGRRFVGDSIESFEEGDLVLLGPNLPHFWENSESPSGKAEAHSIVVFFCPDLLGMEVWSRPEFLRIHRLLSRAARGLHFKGRVAREVAAHLRVLPQRTGMAALTELLTLLEKLAAHPRPRPLASASYVPVLNGQAEDRMARVYAYAAAHFQETVTLAELARAAAMSPAAFSRYFKRTTGRAPSDFLNDLRVEQACRLLRESDWPVTRISLEVGFSTLTSFNRRFRERTASTPRDYRRSFAVPMVAERFLTESP